MSRPSPRIAAAVELYRKGDMTVTVASTARECGVLVGSLHKACERLHVTIRHEPGRPSAALADAACITANADYNATKGTVAQVAAAHGITVERLRYHRLAVTTARSRRTR